MQRTLLSALATVLLLAAGCVPPAPVEGPGEEAEPTPRPPQVVSESFSVRASVEQVYVWNAEVDVGIELVDASGALIAEGQTDYQGSLVLRLLPPGMDYVVRLADAPDDLTDQIDVVSIEDSLPPESLYESQTMVPGNGYLTMRDGTLLAYFLTLPGPIEEGPYPTLLSYSGYSPSRPGRSLGAQVEPFCGLYPVLCNAPDFPAGIFGTVMGYATVGVNVRGTGCSGGAYDYFEPLQGLDGYDVIEIIARQSWVQDNEVAMTGLSYPGIAQLFVAQHRPPSLAAIAPMSVIADTASSTLAPGGIFNNGFAQQWIEGVLERAEPYGHDWIQDVVDAGDTVCEEHQLLHSQLLDAIAKAELNPYYTDEVAKPLDPSTFVDRIEVPVFMTGQWHDEQTGPHFPALFDKFDSAPLTRFTATNGVHPDGYSPQTLSEWGIFMSLYVKKEVPHFGAGIGLLAPIFMENVFGDDMDLPPNRFADYTDYAQALADYEAEDPVQILFESGAADDVAPGAPKATFRASFAQWPPTETVPIRWFLQPDGTLAPDPPGSDGGSSAFEQDPEAGARGTLAGGSVDPPQPNWDWRQPADGQALSFETEALAEDMVLMGHGSVDLWLQTDQTDADLQVTITEVRADGMESMVQHGWLRASHRALRDDATELRPVKSHYEEDVVPLSPGEWTPVRVEVMPFGHVFRAGSRLRLLIGTPGDSMARWRFKLTEYDSPPTQLVAHDADRPSSVVLSLIPGLEVPPDQPECHSLRGQPCREYAPVVNARR